MRSVNFDCGVFASNCIGGIVRSRRSLFTLDQIYRIELLCRCLAERLNKPPFAYLKQPSRASVYCAISPRPHDSGKITLVQ